MVEFWLLTRLVLLIPTDFFTIRDLLRVPAAVMWTASSTVEIGFSCPAYSWFGQARLGGIRED